MQKYTAIILSSRDIGEFDRLYAMYTLEQGLVRTVARGVRKSTAKLAGHLEPGTLSEVYVARSRGTGQIVSAIMLDNFGSVKNDFEKLQEILKIFSFLLKNFSEGEKDERVFELLKSFLETVNGEKLLLEAFWWKLFDALGQRPEVMKCAHCRKRLVENSEKFFSAEKGGVIPAACRVSSGELVPVSNNQIKLLRIFWANPLAKIAKVKVGEKELRGLGRIREIFRRYNF